MDAQADVKQTPLDALFGEKEVTLADGRKIEVFKLKMKYIKRALVLVTSIVAGLTEEGQPQADLLSAIASKSSPTGLDRILQLISNHWDEAFELISLHTVLSPEEAGELDIDDGTLLIAAVLRRNADFFEQRLLPLLAQMAAEAAVAVESKGKSRQPQK